MATATQQKTKEPMPDTPQDWLRALFPESVPASFAQFHADMLQWVWGIKAGVYCRPFVGAWFRGAGKSTLAEGSSILVGARETRKYLLYLSGIQDQADKHVEAIAAKLESKAIENAYPSLGSPQIGKYGNVRGWRRSRLTTESGFTVESFGLDSGLRGIKIEDYRPDFIILDDIDSSKDSMEVIEKKIHTLTHDILPARAPHATVLAVQNLIHGNSIFSRLVDGRADFLADRIVSGPYKALDNMEWEYQDGKAIITAGTPTWEYMDREACQREVITIGIKSFLVELQHEVELAGNPRFNLEAIKIAKLQVQPPLPQSALPEQFQNIKGLSVWALPRPGEPYAGYTDCAEGVGQDYTATMLGETRTGRHVVTLEDNDRNPNVHAAIVVKLLRWYNDPLYGWEREKAGDLPAVIAAEGYSRVYWHAREQTSNQLRAGTEPSKMRGYPMNTGKKTLIDRFATAIETFAFSSPSERFWEQAEHYIVNKDNKTEAEAGYNDDLQYAAAGFIMLCEQPGAKSMRATTVGGGVPTMAYGTGPRLRGR